jgi:hypothetical protein
MCNSQKKSKLAELLVSFGTLISFAGWLSDKRGEGDERMRALFP